MTQRSLTLYYIELDIMPLTHTHTHTRGGFSYTFSPYMYKSIKLCHDQ